MPWTLTFRHSTFQWDHVKQPSLPAFHHPFITHVSDTTASNKSNWLNVPLSTVTYEWRDMHTTSTGQDKRNDWTVKELQPFNYSHNDMWQTTRQADIASFRNIVWTMDMYGSRDQSINVNMLGSQCNEHVFQLVSCITYLVTAHYCTRVDFNVFMARWRDSIVIHFISFKF